MYSQRAGPVADGAPRRNPGRFRLALASTELVRMFEETMATIPNNAPKLRKTLNELARKLYANIGYIVAEGFDFQNSQHPQERAMFEAACIAYEHFGLNRGKFFWRVTTEEWVAKNADGKPLFDPRNRR